MRRHGLIAVFALAGLVAAGSISGADLARGDRSNPYPVRTTVLIPDSKGWKVRVNKSTPNANALIAAENQFNDKPAAGRQFFMINVTLSYVGKGSASPFFEIGFSGVGRSNVEYGEYEDGCGVVPGEIQNTKKVFSGGKMSGNLCFSVRKTDVASFLLYVKPTFSFDDVQKFFRVR